ncbi:MAG: metallophosphoesterase [Armatimonadetes bacterium]|nr:metallophosphoesterase [Armatimonadota bacterium]MDW8154233.1 metallophosphoesterase [Armatimonadota bacterium]
MRIYALADIHGKPERIRLVERTAEQLRPQVVVIAGDLTHAGRGREALQLLSTLPALVVAIPGNMDPADVEEAIPHHPGRRVIVQEGVRFGGLQGEACDILVSHEPPYGILDRAWTGQHIGSRAVRELVEQLQPRVVVCGHVHECPGVARLDRTVVVNCTMGNDRYLGALITWQEPEPLVELLPR